MADEASTATASPESDQAPGVEVHDADLPPAGDGPAQPGEGQIDLLLEAAVTVSVRLGQTEMKIGDLLQMGPDSVITLSRMVGEPLDLYLRGKRIATGDLVLVEDNLGVRIREILKPTAVEDLV